MYVQYDFYGNLRIILCPQIPSILGPLKINVLRE